MTNCVISARKMWSLLKTNLFLKGLIYTSVTLVKWILTTVQLIHVSLKVYPMQDSFTARISSKGDGAHTLACLEILYALLKKHLKKNATLTHLTTQRVLLNSEG